MNLLKNIALWCATVFLILISIGTLPSFASLFAIIIALIIIPIKKWKSIIEKYINGKIKVIVIIVLTIIMFLTVPSTDTLENEALIDTVASQSTNVTSSKNTITSSENLSSSKITKSSSSNKASSSSSKIISSDKVSSSSKITSSSSKPVYSSKPAQVSSAPTHTHTFAAATCTTPKTCSCGLTEGTAVGHSWQDATYTVAKKCSTCGATDGAPLEKPGEENYHGHVYTGGSSSKKFHYEANCAGKNSHEITWEDVTKRNLGPCGTCVLK